MSEYTPVPGIVNRELSAKEADVLNSHSHLLEECVTFASNALDWCAKSSIAESGFHHGPVILLFRHVMEAVEGVAVLLRAGCCRQWQPLLRTSLEAVLSIDFILDRDTQKRGMCYVVSHIHRRIRLHDRHDPQTQSGKKFREDLRKDRFCPINPQRPHDSKAHIMALANVLAKREYHEAEDAYQKLQTPNRKSPPAWYTMADGTQSLRSLAKQLNAMGTYDVLYSDWSEHSHAASVMSMVEGDTRTIVALHDLSQCSMMSSLATSFLIHSTHRLLSAYAPNRLAEYKTWYSDKVRPMRQQLGQIGPA